MLKYLFDHTKEHYFGNPQAPIELMEYGDFQCAHSATVYAEIKKLQQAMGDQLKFVFRHYPFSGHSLAFDAAVLAEAASLQGKFWQMHDLFLENQEELSLSVLSMFAEEIGIDLASIKDNQMYEQLVQKVNNDLESGRENLVFETPVFFINGYRYTGYRDFESLYKTCEFLLDFKQAA
jgi:protein-disulfide isomerase